LTLHAPRQVHGLASMLEETHPEPRRPPAAGLIGDGSNGGGSSSNGPFRHLVAYDLWEDPGEAFPLAAPRAAFALANASRWRGRGLLSGGAPEDTEEETALSPLSPRDFGALVHWVHEAAWATVEKHGRSDGRSRVHRKAEAVPCALPYHRGTMCALCAPPCGFGRFGGGGGSGAGPGHGAGSRAAAAAAAAAAKRRAAATAVRSDGKVHLPRPLPLLSRLPGRLCLNRSSNEILEV